MNVSLTPELDNFVHLKVKSGRYNSASEVVREALRIMQDHENMKGLQLEEIRQRIQAGLDDLSHGRAVEGTIEELTQRTLERGRKTLETKTRKDA
jgi:antitoxin ParD1/3/4